MTPKKVHLVSLGCPKNRVDSEVMLGHLARAGYQAVDAPVGADVVVVNTCGFIEAAKEESVQAIVELAQHKENGDCQKLVVTGCLSQRYAPELAREIPEVDHFLGTGNFETIAQVLDADGAAVDAQTPRGHPALAIVDDHPQQGTATSQRAAASSPGASTKSTGRIVISDPDFTLSSDSPRLASQPSHTRYLKVSEGCSNRCAFCIIPMLRGPQRSRPVSDVVSEATDLVERGAVEINLIAQDLCAYGKDLQPRGSLSQLLRGLESLGMASGRQLWIRCLYAYPRGLTAETIDVIATAEHIVPYLDMPLQHISDPLLRRMRRGRGGRTTRELLRRLRRAIPRLTLRTTFITGLPGETEADFQELMELVEEVRFERVGVFAYSREEDTPAATMPNQVAQEVAEQRRDRLMALQQSISREQQQSLLGETIEVLVEGVSEETDLLLQGRHAGQAPEIDGLTYINSGTASPGQLVRVLVDQAGDYDVVGGIVDKPPQPSLS